MVKPSQNWQRAIRLGAVVLFACAIGYGVILPNTGIHVDHRKEFSQACKWSAITCVVVQAPVIGRVAQTGVERMIGTVVGGLVGFACYAAGRNVWNSATDGVILSLAAAFVAGSSVLLGKALQAENSAKLYALTFLLVTFGASELDSGKGAFVLAMTRITGICSGVILTEIASVLIFPASATGEALRHMRTALTQLAELNSMTWQHGPVSPRKPAGSGAGKDAVLDVGGRESAPDGYQALPGEPDQGAWAVAVKQQQDAASASCEKLLMDVYNALYSLQDALPPARSEIYAGKLAGRLVFFPGLPWVRIPGWGLPEVQMQAMATTIRRAARLLWALHLSFQDGFDQAMQDMLKQQFPARMMGQLRDYSQGAFQEAATAFPNHPQPHSKALRNFVASVEALLAVSDYQRRRVLKHMKLQRPTRGSSLRPVPGSKREDQPPAAPTEPGSRRFQRMYTNRESFRRSSISQLGSRAGSGDAAGETPVPGAGDPDKEACVEASGASSPTQQHQQQQHPDGAADAELDRRKEGQEGSSPAGREASLSWLVSKAMWWPSKEGPAGSKSDAAEGDQPAPVKGPEEQLSAPSPRPGDPAELHAAASLGRVSPFQVLQQGDEGGRLGRGTTMGSSFTGSPGDIFEHLPRELRITVEDGSEPHTYTGHNAGGVTGAPSNGVASEDAQDADLEPLELRLNRVSSDQLIIFPETAEGHVSQVRWYSFQFLVEELADELTEMHAILGDLLAKLPNPFVLSEP